MAVASRLDYSYSSTWTQTVDSSLSMQYPLLAESGPDSFRQLSASAGVTHHAERSASAPFPFTSSLSAPGSDWYTWVSVPAAVAWQWNAGTEAAALVPAPAVNAWVRATTFLPVLSLPATEEQLDVLGEVRLPTIGHQSVAAGVKLSQDFGPAGPAGTGSFTSPRGFGSRTQPLPGAVLGSIDYLLPLLLDQPLALGVAMTAAAFDLHAEALADFDAAAGLFTTVPAVFAGAELTARFVYGTFELPLGIGVTAALRGGAAGFDASRDLRIYLTAGFDTLDGQSDHASLHPAGAPWYISGNAR
ncbi:MAG TPA: hypothetical protein VFI08_06520, partial [Spirochaetia bacterium]|nr:hypothetical protein [Spirochaetia bacterium]